MGSYFEGGSPSNYTIGGTRFWFDRLVDDSVTPNLYEGYRDMGNVVEAPDEQSVDVLEHFSARSGTRTKDRSLTKEISEQITLTLDELSVYNLRNYFRALTISDVAASTATQTVVDEVMQLVGVEPRILGKGYNASTITVKDITGVTTYVLNTDYEVVDIIGGYKGIRAKAGGTIVDGSYVRVGYKYDVRAHKQFNPATKTEILGMALFFGVSDTGQEFIRSFRKVQLEPTGSFNLKDADWSSFQLVMKILDDSEVTPTAPFGLFEHYGKGTNL